MASLRLLANMNISPKTVEALERQGFDVIRVSQRLPVTTSDETILLFARDQSRVVVTQDLDFSMLLPLRGFDRPSLITLRLSASDPETVTRKLRDVLPQIEESLTQGCAVTIEDAAVRVRKLPIE